LREQLFDSASTVEFDSSDLAVKWTTPDGMRRRRPLEAFSSGEQVFAYTRAKLETYRGLKDRTDYLVVFLDEFGAFVARDRFGELMRYVQMSVLGAIADQVVVMLPTSAVDSVLSATISGRAHYEGPNYTVVSVEQEAHA
jgi:hypothetical protein